MLKEVIIVEGKSDIAAVKRAVDAELIATGGYTLSKNTLEKIKAAYEKRGIIILTDPDSAGERIRRRLTELFPLAAQAFIAQEEATAKGDIGIERAAPVAIQAALAKVRTQVFAERKIFTTQDMFASGLSGSANAAQKRNSLGKLLGLGYSNAGCFLQRLNSYGITREEFTQALQQLEAEG